MIEVQQEGWAELEGLLPDPTAEEAYAFVEKVARLQGLFKPGWLEVHECEVTSQEKGVEEYRATLLARQLSASGRLTPTELVVVRVKFTRTPPNQNAKARFRCTHLSIGLMRLADGILKDRGHGLDITYSAFDSTKGMGMHRVRIRDFPNGWRRTLRYAVLAKLLDWRLERCREEASRYRNDLEKAQQTTTLQEGNNS